MSSNEIPKVYKDVHYSIVYKGQATEIVYLPVNREPNQKQYIIQWIMVQPFKMVEDFYYFWAKKSESNMQHESWAHVCACMGVYV